MNAADGAEKYSVSFQLDIDTEDIFQPYVGDNDVVIFTIEYNGLPKTYRIYGSKDTGEALEHLWDYYAATNAGNFAFGAGNTIYVWGKTGLAHTLYARSEGAVGDACGAGMNYLDNQPPAHPWSPFPSDGATDIGSDATLSWASSDPDGHTLKYDVYLTELIEGQEASLIPVATQLTTASYNLTGLSSNGAQYLWAVVATDGQSVAESPTSSFTTVNDPPSVLSVTPTAGSTNVPINTSVTAEFSESVDPSAVNTSTFVLDNGVTGSVSYDLDTKIATFTPYSDLAYSTTYTATITTGVQDLLGAGLEADHTWSFTTAAASQPSVSLSPLALTFSNQLVGTTSTTLPVTLTNNGTSTLNISDITLTGTDSGDFAQTNTCGATLAASASCTVNVTFEPTATGARSAQLSIASDAVSSPHTVALSGAGMDFTLNVRSGGTTSATVNAGQTATYNLQINPTEFSGDVALACAFQGSTPRGASCSVSPTSVTLNGTDPAPFTVSVATTARAMAVPHEPEVPPGTSPWPRYVLLLLLSALILAAAAVSRRRRSLVGTASLRWIPLWAAMLLVLLWAACGGGGGGGGSTPPPQTGTPAGTYTLTVTGTASGVSRTTNLTLTVN